MRIAIVNPNTNATTTRIMVDIAWESAPPSWTLVGVTARRGRSFIVDEIGLQEACEAVEELTGDLDGHDGVILAAFGDPAIAHLRARLSCPVVGIGEASMDAAARYGRFSVATTTHGLAAAITRMAHRCGHGSALLSVTLTEEDPHVLMADSVALERALSKVVNDAADGGAHAVIIGGGPLTPAVRALAPGAPVPLIDPIRAAVERLAEHLGADGGCDVANRTP